MPTSTPIDRRDFLRKGAVATGAAASLGWMSFAASGSAQAASTCRWGALSLRGSSQQSAITELEKLVGRRFDTTHYRMPWTSSLNNKFTSWSASTGHTQILSWFARTKTSLISWRGIAAGNEDAWITTQARTLKATGWKGYLCFHKEPEDEGNSTDWKAAYHRVHQIFDNVGVTGMKWVVCLMASTYQSGKADEWMPATYDLLGVDGYNRYRCVGKPWKSFSDVFSSARGYAQSKGRDLYVVEAGCVEGEPGRKAQWFTDARATIKAWPEIVGFSYNDEDTGCTYWIDSSSASLTSFKAMGQDPYFL